MAYRIYISVCGEGFGHSSRAIAVAEELLKHNCEVILGSYGYVYSYLKKLKRFKVVKIPRELVIEGEKGTFSLRKTFMKTFKKTLVGYKEIISKEKKLMKRLRVSCVVSDGRISPIIAGGYELGLPVIYITNWTMIRESFLKNKILKLFIKRPVDIITKIASLFSEDILIPDFPPPNTICQYMLSKNNFIKKKMSFIGPLVRTEVYKSKPIRTKKPTIVAIIGGHEYRRPLIEAIIDASRLAKDINFIVISHLIPRKKIEDNLKLLPFVKNVYPYMLGADLLITQAGHSTIMEMICSNKTGILIPDKGQFEQEANARKMKELRLAEVITYDRLSPKLILSKIRLLLERKEYKRNVEKLAKLAKKLPRSKKIVELCIQYSKRMEIKY
jgi:uncharacterized protein (TIGR00661 family)